jgi:putative Mg2+ transporter-C (MgtC) family protein
MPVTDYLVRLFTALGLGAAVGLERQWRQRMAGTRTTALVAAGACAFVMCAFLVRDTTRSEAQIVSYVVSGVGFLGAGVIFKDGGTVRGLNTAATIWCSAAIGATCGLGHLLYRAIVGAAVLIANLALRPLAYRVYPSQQGGLEQEVTYVCDVVCRPDDEAHIRALLLQAIALTSLTLTALKSEDIEGTAKMKVAAQIRGLGRHDQALEQMVGRLSLEGSVTSISWALSAQILE